jgi:hypothetical protein
MLRAIVGSRVAFVKLRLDARVADRAKSTGTRTVSSALQPSQAEYDSRIRQFLAERRSLRKRFRQIRNVDGFLDQCLSDAL